MSKYVKKVILRKIRQVAVSLHECRVIIVRSEAARDAAPEGTRMRTSCREASLLPFGCRCACQNPASAMTLRQTSKKRKIDSGILPESKVFEGSS
jgi:hypothetical protein